MIFFGDLKSNKSSILSIPSQICQVINCLKEKDEQLHAGITPWLIRASKTFRLVLTMVLIEQNKSVNLC